MFEENRNIFDLDLKIREISSGGLGGKRLTLSKPPKFQTFSVLEPITDCEPFFDCLPANAYISTLSQNPGWVENNVEV